VLRIENWKVKLSIRVGTIMAYSQANVDVEERRDKRDEILAPMEAPSWARKHRY
jgi:hypothetical protein